MWGKALERLKILVDALKENSLIKRLNSEKYRTWFFVGGSVLTGILTFILFMDIIVMPLYLQEGVTVRVPDITNKTRDEAVAIARRSQLLVIADSSDYNEFIAKDLVSSQKPFSGSLVKPGRRIHLIISKGSQVVVMPDLSGLSPVDAEKVLRNAGLVVEDKRIKRSKRFSSGTVMDQYPDAGTEVQAKSGVTISIAR